MWKKIKDTANRIWSWTKRNTLKVLIVIGLVGVASAMTLIPGTEISPMEKIEYKNKWLGSYETLKFDTLDGDLDFNQYVVQDNGYYVRTKPKDEAQFEFVETLDTTGMEEVNIVEGEKCYYDEFLTAKGANAIWKEAPEEMPSEGILRLPSTGKDYWDTAKIKNYPQPERFEEVAELPPPEPPQPRNEPQSIALDAVSTSGRETSTSSYSWSHETSGSDRLLVVGHSHHDQNAETVTGITFNGDAVTHIRTDAVNNRSITALYYRLAPDTGGSYTVAVSLSGAVDNAIGGAISYTGVAQEGPEVSDGANGDSQLATLDITTVADNSWVVAVLTTFPWANPATSTNTERWQTAVFYLIGGAGSDTGGPKTPAGVQTMSWELNAPFDRLWAISAASFAPAVGEPPAERRIIIIQ